MHGLLTENCISMQARWSGNFNIMVQDQLLMLLKIQSIIYIPY